MTLPPRLGLSDAEKDALLLEQAAMIQCLAARIAELEAIPNHLHESLTQKPLRRLGVE